MRKVNILTLILCISANAFAFETGLNVLRYDVTLEPDIQKKSIQGTVTVLFQLPLNEHFLVLNSGNLGIDSVQGKYMELFTKSGETLKIKLSESRELQTTVTIHFSGSPTKGLLFDQSKELAYTSYFTSHWMVCNDIPGDKAKVNLNILVPKGLDCVASGQLNGMEENDGKNLYHWSQNYDSPTYSFGFAIGKFNISETSTSEIRIKNYAYDYSATDLKQIFKETPLMISFFEEKSGVEYTQPTYSQILIGNKYQEMSGYSILKDSYGTLVLNDSTETNLISHELAHQWWGNHITCKNWNHFWLNEALATYMSAAYNEYRFGQEKYNADIESYFNVYKDIKARNKDRSLVFKDWSNPTRDDRNIVYFKGAYVLHLIRQEIGDDTFWQGIKSYSRKYFDQTVTTSDFQRMMEAASGRDLDDFFQNWVY